MLHKLRAKRLSYIPKKLTFLSLKNYETLSLECSIYKFLLEFLPNHRSC